ncbi:FecR domain-containing protein [Comamonas terrigena]|uniref:FecR domain-containing protein n=1 Tax=Comamonas terrigena TaxID=32013 RepID=UPI00244A39BD|nr:FecR domain-containing protein [Comamonas terrigena]MDH1703132.1 FecR domain-containing protein [Comamonas terrigena]
MSGTASTPLDGASGDPIDPAILGEAADWLMQLHEGSAGPEQWQAIEGWRASSPAHARAWQRAEALMGDLRSLPGGPVRATLERPARSRRHLLRLLWLPLLAPASWLAWRQFDLSGERWHSATGAQRTIILADGTRLLLNTDTTVAVQFDTQVRRIRLLGGEVLVTSAPDPAAVFRPLLLETSDGSIRPIGTRFSVRRAQGETASRVAVFEGAVVVEADGRQRRLDAGERMAFDAGGPGAVERLSTLEGEAWTHGLIVARRMRLADLVAELDRYRPGLLRCHPEVADLLVSGTFPALTPERSLQLLAATLPVQVRHGSVYWATVEPVQARD